jgi:hypothetical protein
MCMLLMDGIAWLIVIGLACGLLIFALAGLGATIGATLAAIRDGFTAFRKTRA